MNKKRQIKSIGCVVARRARPGCETRFFCLPGKICRLSRVKRGWA
jgi:hypothetical protein